MEHKVCRDDFNNKYTSNIFFSSNSQKIHYAIKILFLVITWKAILPQLPSMADLIKNILKAAPTFLENITELLKNQDYESVLVLNVS